MHGFKRWATPFAVGTLALASLTSGCGKSENGGTGPGETPAIGISISKNTMSIVQGGSDALTATITRSGGFTGTVNIATEGAPTGVTAAVSNISTSGGTTTGTVTVSVAGTVTPGTYNLTIRASGTGVTDKTVALALTVTATPAISIAITGSPVNAQAGGSGTAQVAITRTNFTGNVTLALEGAPTGVTGSFNPAPATGNASTLTIQVGAAVVAGTYPMTVRATGTGVTDATAPVSVTVSVPSNFDISLNRAALTVPQGSADNVVVTITRTNFTGVVTFSVDGAPQGVTPDFEPNNTDGNTSTLTLTVGVAVTPGLHNLTIKANSPGQPEQTEAVALTVTAVVVGNYSLTTTPSGSASIQQGGGGNVTVNLVRTGGFAGSVDLAVTGAPNGLTANLTPASTTGNSSTLALSATGGLPIGNYPLTITGTFTGLANQTVNLTVNVTAPSGSGNVSLDYSACDVTDRPRWVAYQDGTAGAWVQVAPVGNVFTFNITQAKAGLAIVTSDDGLTGFATLVEFLTQAEMIAFSGPSNCAAPTPGKTVTGTTANLAATQTARVSLGGAGASPTFLAPAFTLNDVASGTNDLVAYAHDILSPGTGDRGVIIRDLNPPANSSVGTVDFTGGSSFAAASGSMTLTGATGGETIIHGMTYHTGSACTASPLYTGSMVTGTTFDAFGVPSGSQRGTDRHALSVSAVDGSTSFRSVIEFFSAMGNRTIALPSVLPTPTLTALAGPYKRLRFQFTMPNDFTQFASLGYTEVAEARSFFMFASPGYLGSQTIDLSAPDLSGAAGWSNSWAPASAASVTWLSTGSGSNLTSGCTAGSRVVSATKTGTI